MKIIDGKEIAKKVFEEVKRETENLSSKPSIAVILVGDNLASGIYVRNKEKKAVECGFESRVLHFEAEISQQRLEDEIDKLNKDNNVDAILVQLPLPKHIDTYRILEKILPDKDVDGFHPENAGRLFSGLKPYAIPCTPTGIIRLLKEYEVPLEGSNAVVIGRSNIVGKPISMLLLAENATVTMCHSKTENIKEIVKTADIVVSAVGIPLFVKGDWIKEGAIVIDVGINRNEDNKLVGDVDFEVVKDKASLITPVPGGVGPMTIAMLLKNTIELHKLHKSL